MPSLGYRQASVLKLERRNSLRCRLGDEPLRYHKEFFIQARTKSIIIGLIDSWIFDQVGNWTDFISDERELTCWRTRTRYSRASSPRDWASDH